MPEAKKDDASTARTEKKGSVSDDFGKDFLNSWKSMSSEDDGLDFNQEVLPKGKKNMFNFDKLDMDFSLDGDFGKKMSSFNVDMSDLDFNSPPKKPLKPKEGSTEETQSEKKGGKQSRFNLTFDFNELDSFDFGSSFLKGENKSDKAESLKGFDSPRKEKVQMTRSKTVMSFDLHGDSDTDNVPLSQHASTTKFDHLEEGISKSNVIITSLSTSANSGNLSAFHGTAASPKKERTVVGKETAQCSQQSDQTVSTEPNAQNAIQELSTQSMSMEGSIQDASLTQGEVCSSDTEESMNPEESPDNNVKVCNPESSPTKRIPGPSTECKKMSENTSVVQMGDTPRNEYMEGNTNIRESSGEKSHTMLHSLELTKENSTNSKLLSQPLPSEPKTHQPTKANGRGGVQSKYISRSLENEPQQNTQTIPMKASLVGNRKAGVILSSAPARSESKSYDAKKDKETCIVQSKYFKKPVESDSKLNSQSNSEKVSSFGNKRDKNVLVNPPDPRRPEHSLNDAEAGNQRADGLKPQECAGMEGVPIMQGNQKSSQEHEIPASFQVQSEERVKSDAPKSLNSRLVSSISYLRNSKSSYVEGKKLSTLRVDHKKPEASSLKVSNLLARSDASHTKDLAKGKTLLQSEKTAAIQSTKAKMDYTAGVEQKGPISPSTKRKMCEEPNEDSITLYPLKRAAPDLSEFRGLQESCERPDKEQAQSNGNTLDSCQPSPIPDVPRGCWKELPVPVLMEDDGIVEKSQAYSKELDDICNLLKKKHDEAKEVLVRAIVNNNELLMLNHPIYEEKIWMVQQFVSLRLSPGASNVIH